MNIYYRYYVTELRDHGYFSGYYSKESDARKLCEWLRKNQPDREFRIGRITMRDCKEIRNRLEKEIDFMVSYPKSEIIEAIIRRYYATDSEAAYYMRIWEKKLINRGATIIYEGITFKED